ncbi:MAG: NAD(P)-dependent oxidoreductase [Thermaerobacter sp.]|nr:NAD(P)-dependent oxidoreductase [Thermaerobacter sp.]
MPEFTSDLVMHEVVGPLTTAEAREEALRCYYCYDAPCIRGCPTAIDIPVFIKHIATGHLLGAARTILDANPLGATCARICPTEALCEGACVRGQDSRPVAIGRLQRTATDAAMAGEVPDLPEFATAGHGRVAVVGAGPSGLSAASYLRRLGYEVDVFEERPAGGGLDTYGIVSFREPVAVSLWEVERAAKMGVQFHYGVRAGRDVSWDALREGWDAVVLAVGLGRVPRLGIGGEELPGVYDALELVEASKTGPLEAIRLFGTVAVVGAGNTAVDAATLAKRLGADRVIILYRRGEEAMPAYAYEYAFAKQEGIEYRWWTRPLAITGASRVEGIRVVSTRPASGQARSDRQAQLEDVADSVQDIPVSAVIRAVGQEKPGQIWSALGVLVREGRVVVDSETFETSLTGVYAIGDGLARPGEATVVQGVADGKRCAFAVHHRLTTGRED